MRNAKVTVDEWVDMFRSIGLDDDRMLEWHKEFERRHPDAHESFLQWLGLSAERISDIRARAAPLEHKLSRGTNPLVLVPHYGV